jgi:hypothetical protein
MYSPNSSILKKERITTSEENCAVEDLIEEHDESIAAFEKQIRLLEERAEEAFSLLGVSKEDLDTLFSSEAMFSSGDRAKLDQQKDAWREEIHRNFDNITTPSQKRESFEKLRQIQSWFKI